MSDPSDNPLKRLIREIHRRSLWQVAACMVLCGCGGSGGPVQPPPGSPEILVTTETLGDDQDLDGYSLVVGGRPGIFIGLNEQLTVRDLAERSHAVQLTGIAANCRQTGVERAFGPETYTFVVFCLPPESGTIYYIGGLTLSSMNAIGGDRKTIGPSGVWDLSVSPDGDRIALMYLPPGEGLTHIYIVRTDGSDLVQLTDLPGQENYGNLLWADEHPAFSPDGLRVAYQGGLRNPSRWDIFVINSDGAENTNITRNQRGNFTPDWSP